LKAVKAGGNSAIKDKILVLQGNQLQESSSAAMPNF
jgi:hypothetical protein